MSHLHFGLVCFYTALYSSWPNHLDNVTQLLFSWGGFAENDNWPRTHKTRLTRIYNWIGTHLITQVSLVTQLFLSHKPVQQKQHRWKQTTGDNLTLLWVVLSNKMKAVRKIKTITTGRSIQICSSPLANVKATYFICTNTYTQCCSLRVAQLR